MKTKTRNLGLVMTALMLLGLLAACGDSTATSVPATTAAATSAAAATTAKATTAAAVATTASVATTAAVVATTAAGGVATTAVATTAATGTNPAVVYPPTLAGGPIDQIVFAQGVDPTTLDPNDHNETPAGNVLNNIYDTLIFWSPDLKLVPRLAESWKQLDEVTWEIKLRKGVKWQDGSDFSADDVKFTFDRYQKADRQPRPVQRRANLKSIKETKVVDPNTLQITTSAPFPSLPNQLAVEGIVSKKYGSGDKGDTILELAPMGTGPYKFVEWKKNDYIDMVINPNYWGPAPKAQKVRFRTIPDAQTRLSALQSGAVDVITNVAPELVDQLNKSDKTGITTAPSVRVIFIILNSLDEGPLKNAKVRQALNMAVDRDGIIKAILNDNGIKIAQPLTDRHFGYNPNISQYAYDPDKAKQLLKEAGYPNGFEMTFNFPNGRYLKDKEIGEAIASQWADIGVKTKTSSPVWTDYVGLINNRKQAQAYLLGWGNNTWDADNTLFTLLDKPKADVTVADGSVYSYWINEKAQKNILEAKTVSDVKKRESLYQEAEQIVHDDAAWVFLHQQKDIYAFNKAKIKWQARSDEALNAFEVAAAK